ncbi:hypothetical protein DRN02_007820 [Sphingomonas paucimobilis]|uniref:hypothetical protein n=1 Tax=Sphingomonas paucimobilis TaxID=13689 RepID=UPI000DE39E8B|nr:hypothetical protein [Sphingomonas paucimobilis]QBE91932.1 hypothetical protein DRN02_007820 [Sphingomonas paucimobilis]
MTSPSAFDDRTASLDRTYEEAKRHLDGLKAEIAADSRPCRRCRHGSAADYSFQQKCRNPILQRGEYDAVKGKLTWRSPDWGVARRRGGACGPEALLFEIAPPLVRLWRSAPEPFRWGIIAMVGPVLLALSIVSLFLIR